LRGTGLNRGQAKQAGTNGSQYVSGHQTLHHGNNDAKGLTSEQPDSNTGAGKRQDE
jgi:hypothetical protein